MAKFKSIESAFSGPAGEALRETLGQVVVDLDTINEAATADRLSNTSIGAIGGAVGQLLSDLSRLSESERSPYENALRHELLEIGELLTRLNWSIRPLEKIVAGPADVTRITCSKRDCPNKRR